MHTYHRYIENPWKQSIRRFRAICADRFRGRALERYPFTMRANELCALAFRKTSIQSDESSGERSSTAISRTVQRNWNHERVEFPRCICIATGLYFFDIEHCGVAKADSTVREIAPLPPLPHSPSPSPPCPPPSTLSVWCWLDYRRYVVANLRILTI